MAQLILRKPFWLLLLSGLFSLVLTGCPSTHSQNSYIYLRSPVTFRIDTVPANHPFCFSGRTPFANVEDCLNARKYRLIWERPEDTVGFTEYRIFVDTMPPNAPGMSWSQVRQDRSLASFILPGTSPLSDSIIFVLGASGSPQALSRDSARIVTLDTTNRVDSAGRLVFAITTTYRDGGGEGLPRYTWVVTTDRFSPYPIQPIYTPLERSVEVHWGRPRDPTSFFNAAADSGIIRNYVLRIVRGGVFRATAQGFTPQVTYLMGGTDRTAEVQRDSFTTLRRAPGFKFTLPDGHRVLNRSANDPIDSMKVVVSGLTPLDTVDLTVWAADSSGNLTDSTLVTRLILTDTTTPTTPHLQLSAGSVTRNQFAYSFSASTDLVESGSGLVPAPTPNANILEYHISRRRIGGSPGGSTDVDSLLGVDASTRGNLQFQDTARYLPPGATYRLYVTAVDSTGHLSLTDSLDVSTLSSTFTGPDSGTACASGFIPIPAGSFMLGDTAAARGADEAPAGFDLKRRYLKSYCIEPYEHQNGLGGFTTRVTWQQASDICQALAPGDSSHLCTEAEWERACEGTDPVPLTYGIQSEQRDPGGVRYTCNIGTGDSAMALSLAARNPSCLSYDGVFDMPGNLAEWVLDPYDTASYLAAGDTLTPGHPLLPLSPSSVRGFRGSHYLNSGQAPSVQLNSARCSNRDYPTQVRPRPYPGCSNASGPQLVVLYASKSPRCLSLPDSTAGRSIVSVIPGRDSTQILFLFDGRPQPYTYTMPLNDTNYLRYRPYQALLSTRSLAVVTFDNASTSESVVDTLDATEMRDTSDAVLSEIFNREAAPPWSVRRAGGRYAISYYYAFTQLQSLTAKPYYSNSVLGFRCCSLPHAGVAAKRPRPKPR